MRVLVNPFDEAEKMAMERGKWVVAVLETHVFWPTKKQTIHYDGKIFLLLPAEQHEGLSSKTQPAIAIKASAYGLSPEDARKELLRFASALSWREGLKIEIVGWSGGNIPRSMGIIRNSGISDYLNEDYLPAPTNESARTALAFYREGISLDNPFYAFLSLYKAFSVAIPNGRARDGWMTAKRNELKDEKASDRATEIEESGGQVGPYLYEKCRHAIAHADREPYVNPDNTDDHFRVSKDLPLMRNFAELAIQESFEINKPSTIHREHLYELEGFRKILPQAVVAAFKKGLELQGTQEIELPDQYLLLARRGHERYPLPPMGIADGGYVKGGLILDFTSKAGVVRIRVMLDFAEEKLRFDPMSGLAVCRNRNDPLMAKEELAALRFERGILSNGCLEIWDTDVGHRLGCTAPYIPVNCFVNHEYYENEITAVEKIINTENDE